jgi:hypothetical protein
MVLVVVMVLLSSTGYAQERMTAATWQVSFPTDDMEQFVGNTSFRGFGLQGRWFTSETLSVGFSWAWQVFDWETDQLLNAETTQLEGFTNLTVSGQQYRYINSFPFLLTARWYFGNDQRSNRFYVGAGAGVYYIKQRLEIGLVAFNQDEWHWGVAPEIGFLFPVGDVYGHQNILVSGVYNYAAGTNDSIDFAYWTMNLGITWNPDF